MAAIHVEDFGARVVSVWEGLRPATRSLMEHALLSNQTATSGAAAAAATPTATPSYEGGANYDARAEWELSRLLAALDERWTEGSAALSAAQTRELSRMAETCALVLQHRAHSAEIFAQLLERALRRHDYTRIDALADTLAARLAPSETCELARHPNAAVRAIAQEVLLQTPTTVLIGLLNDPVDAETARDALERQAGEYGVEEARWIIEALERAEASEEDT